MKKLLFLSVIIVLVDFSSDVILQELYIPPNHYHTTFRTTLQDSESQTNEKSIKYAFENYITYTSKLEINSTLTIRNYIYQIPLINCFQPTNVVLRI